MHHSSLLPCSFRSYCCCISPPLSILTLVGPLLHWAFVVDMTARLAHARILSFTPPLPIAKFSSLVYFLFVRPCKKFPIHVYFSLPFGSFGEMFFLVATVTKPNVTKESSHDSRNSPTHTCNRRPLQTTILCCSSATIFI
jgi:hypothetical protein